MTPDILSAIGAALYGEHWQAQLCADLGVTGRTMRRWLDGSRQIPAGVLADLKYIASERVGEINHAVKELYR